MTTVTVPNLRDYDIIVINSSAGKDSMAMMAEVAEHARLASVMDRIVVIHNDLGTTPSGEPIEWAGVEELAREHAAMYGFRFETTRRAKGGLWDQLMNERKKFPSSESRWCTSDQKTSQGMKVVTALVREIKQARGLKPRQGPPVQVLYCLGLRGEESKERAKKPALSIDEPHSNTVRTITRWLPIKDWTVKEVWDRIRVSGMRPHAAYSWGMGRLSCSFCVLASKPDLIRAAQLRPVLAAEFVEAEVALDHTFKQGLSMAQIVEEANREEIAA